ncbi:N-acylneuraminate-9-phosphatase isoform X1 [Amborella trichopoda]|uniref:Uncharacterized protein n=1 Tax=Amborella trichopoda TaxID=13333 RepID=W1PAS9_AMBTC|nr:N-acylneuraminate-9-phosphatase isoform X1 [Amborella trichopoda]XP_020521670.1 N-acylneuraminate-9-phosphatase isoform X1 [Amborella trichopoda]ERN04130.1 hypothetical protein AMTR_s00077p00058980 [Amborella trichopoda]|eukprot:XP_006842455.1 N-acylneuraminate-9-phosphatase isoform X1 [Amborella trichopoda]
MALKAVFFDLDDTLVLTHAADKAARLAVMELVRKHHPAIEEQEIVDHFWKDFISQPWDPTNQIDVTEWRAQLWNKALQEKGVDDIKLARDIQCLFDFTRMASFRWAPAVEMIVKDLHAQGIKTGIITNGHPKVQRAKLQAAEAHKLFDPIIVGGEEIHEKPHKSIFLKACNLVGSKPEESVMVGDNLKTDIQGAKNANFLAAIWVNTHGLDEIPAGVARPDHTVNSVAEIPLILPLNK